MNLRRSVYEVRFAISQHFRDASLGRKMRQQAARNAQLWQPDDPGYFDEEGSYSPEELIGKSAMAKMRE